MGDYKGNLVEALLLRQTSETILAGIAKDASYLELLLSSLETPNLTNLVDEERLEANSLDYLRSCFEGEVLDYIVNSKDSEKDAEEEKIFDRAYKMTESRDMQIKQSGFRLLHTLINFSYLGEDFANLGSYRDAFTNGLGVESPDIFKSSFSGLIRTLQWDVFQKGFNPEPYKKLAELATPVHAKYIESKKTGGPSLMNEREKTIHRIVLTNIPVLVSYAGIDKRAKKRLDSLFGADFLEDYDSFHFLRGGPSFH